MAFKEEEPQKFNKIIQFGRLAIESKNKSQPDISLQESEVKKLKMEKPKMQSSKINHNLLKNLVKARPSESLNNLCNNSD